MERVLFGLLLLGLASGYVLIPATHPSIKYGLVKMQHQLFSFCFPSPSLLQTEEKLSKVMERLGLIGLVSPSPPAFVGQQ